MRKIDIVFDLDQTLVDSYYLGNNDQEIEENLYKIREKMGGVLDINKVFIIKYFFTKIIPKYSKILTMKRGIHRRHVQKTIIKRSTDSNMNNKPIMISYAVFIRPYTKQLLSWCFNNANVSVWTAGTTDYAMNIISGLFTQQQQKKLKMVLTRDNLNRGFINSSTNKIYRIVNNKRILVKNMNLLFKHPDYLNYGFSPSTSVLIDDLQNNYDTNKKAGTAKNFIKIVAWDHSNINDDKLLNLKDWLKSRNKMLNTGDNINSQNNSNNITR
jgi:hypothetical protein